MRSSKVVSIAAAFTAAAMFGSAAMATPYVWTGGGDGTTWSDALNWSVGFGAPGDAAGDTADTSGTIGDLTVNLSTPVTTNPLTSLTMGGIGGGDTTTISGSAISFATVVSNGAAGDAINIISAPVNLPASGNVVMGASVNPLSITGTITNDAATTRKIQNNSAGQVLTLGAVTLSVTAGRTLLFENDATAASKIVLDGVISNGFGTSGLAFSRGTFEITKSNTYTGNTALGQNSPTAGALYLVHTNSPFGTGTITFGGSSGQTNTLEGLNGTRTLANNLVGSRNSGVQGSNSFVFNGTFTMSSTSTFNNNLTGPATATFTNNIFTANADQGRVWTIAGTGTTIISGVIDDTSGAGPDTIGTVVNSGTGTVILTGANTYHGHTAITGAGKVQIGNSTATGSTANAPVITGGSTGTGAFVLKRSDAYANVHVLNGGIGLNQEGANTVTTSNIQFNTGTNNVGTVGGVAATLLVNGGSVGQTVQTGASVGGNINLGVVAVRQVTSVSTAGLFVGQPVWIDGGSASAASYIRSIDSAGAFTIYGTSLLATGTQNLRFGNGAGLGSGTTLVWNNAILGGTGTIAGTVVALTGGTVAPGASIESLDVAGAQFNSGGKLLVEYDGAGAGSIDLLNVSGALNLQTGSVVDFSLLGAALDDPAYIFATYGTLGGTAGVFSSVLNLPSGYTINYAYSGNNIALVPVVVPEPAALGLLGAGAVGLLGRRRRKTA